MGNVTFKIFFLVKKKKELILGEKMEGQEGKLTITQFQ